MGAVRICREGLSLVIQDLDTGKYIKFPYHTAKLIGKQLISEAKRVEEEVNAEGIANDQAILLRSLPGIGITNNKKIQKEAFKRAEYLKVPNTKTVPHTYSVGTPSIKQEKG